MKPIQKNDIEENEMDESGWKEIQDVSSEMDGTGTKEDVKNKDILLQKRKLRRFKHKYESREYIKYILVETYKMITGKL